MQQTISYGKDFGARGEIRTLTPVRAADFESAASTIPPLGLILMSDSTYSGSRQLQILNQLQDNQLRLLDSEVTVFRKLYTKVLFYSDTKFAPLVLSMVAFWEAIIFPIPPDIVLIPMSLANRKKALIFAGQLSVAMD